MRRVCSFYFYVHSFNAYDFIRYLHDIFQLHLATMLPITLSVFLNPAAEPLWQTLL